MTLLFVGGPGEIVANDNGYEFGCKVGLVFAAKNAFIVGEFALI